MEIEMSADSPEFDTSDLSDSSRQQMDIVRPAEQQSTDCGTATVGTVANIKPTSSANESIPIDVLALIFALAIHDSATGLPTLRAPLRAVCLVSRAWRDAAYCTPALWACIRFVLPGSVWSDSASSLAKGTYNDAVRWLKKSGEWPKMYVLDGLHHDYGHEDRACVWRWDGEGWKDDFDEEFNVHVPGQQGGGGIEGVDEHGEEEGEIGGVIDHTAELGSAGESDVGEEAALEVDPGASAVEGPAAGEPSAEDAAEQPTEDSDSEPPLAFCCTADTAIMRLFLNGPGPIDTLIVRGYFSRCLRNILGLIQSTVERNPSRYPSSPWRTVRALKFETSDGDWSEPKDPGRSMFRCFIPGTLTDLELGLPSRSGDFYAGDPTPNLSSIPVEILNGLKRLAIKCDWTGPSIAKLLVHCTENLESLKLDYGYPYDQAWTEDKNWPSKFAALFDNVKDLADVPSHIVLQRVRTFDVRYLCRESAGTLVRFLRLPALEKLTVTFHNKRGGQPMEGVWAFLRSLGFNRGDVRGQSQVHLKELCLGSLYYPKEGYGNSEKAKAKDGRLRMGGEDLRELSAWFPKLERVAFDCVNFDQDTFDILLEDGVGVEVGSAVFPNVWEMRLLRLLENDSFRLGRLWEFVRRRGKDRDCAVLRVVELSWFEGSVGLEREYKSLAMDGVEGAGGTALREISMDRRLEPPKDFSYCI